MSDALVPVDLPVLAQHVTDLKFQLREVQELLATHMDYNNKLNNQLLEQARELEKHKMEAPTSSTIATLVEQASKRNLFEALEPWQHVVEEVKKEQAELASKLLELQAVQEHSFSQSMPIISSEQRVVALSEAGANAVEEIEGQKMQGSCGVDTASQFLSAEWHDEFRKLSARVTQLEAVEAEESKEHPEQAGPVAHSPFKLHQHLWDHLMHHHLASGLEYDWSESLWDAVLFIGTEQVSTIESLVLISCLGLYLFVLMAFLESCGNSLIHSTFDEQAQHEFNLWRTTVAHEPAIRNVITGESLARSVCEQRLYTPFANLQFDVAANLSEYLGTAYLLGGAQVTAGVLMCTLSLMVWYLTLFVEFRYILDLMAACIGLPCRERTTFEPDPRDASKVVVVAFSPFRFVLLAVIGVLRSTVVGFLAVFGSLFLVYETSMEDMLLNAVALEIILDLDELFFCALLPKVTRTIFTRINPVFFRFERPHWNTYGSYVFIVFVMASAYLMAFTYVLGPFREQLQASHEALCGGVENSLDFVMIADGIGVPWIAKTSSSADVSESYAQFVVMSLKKDGLPHVQLTGEERNNAGLFMQVSNPKNLDRFRVNLPEFKSAADWEMVNPLDIINVRGWEQEVNVLAGADFGDELGTVYNHYLQFLLQKAGVTCKDVSEDRCTKHGRFAEDIVMRKLCPSRCGCPLIHEGSVSNAYSFSSKFGFRGCSIKDTKKKQFVEGLAALPCVNAITFDSFVTWVQGVGDAQAPSGAMLRDELVVAFNSGGCDAVAAYDIGKGAELCEESSLMAICPESCGCNASIPWAPMHARRTDYCPYSCGTNPPVCITIKHDANNTHVKDNHRNTTTARGPLVGFPCVFPFNYKGITYHTCTSEDWHGPWCAVTVSEDDVMHWGKCPDDC